MKFLDISESPSNKKYDKFNLKNIPIAGGISNLESIYTN